MKSTFIKNLEKFRQISLSKNFFPVFIYKPSHWLISSRLQRHPTPPFHVSRNSDWLLALQLSFFSSDSSKTSNEDTCFHSAWNSPHFPTISRSSTVFLLPVSDNPADISPWCDSCISIGWTGSALIRSHLCSRSSCCCPVRWKSCSYDPVGGFRHCLVLPKYCRLNKYWNARRFLELGCCRIWLSRPRFYVAVLYRRFSVFGANWRTSYTPATN